MDARRFGIGLLLAVVFTGVLGAGPIGGAAADSPNVNIAVRPQYAGSTTLSHGHFRFDLTPGASVNDALVVQNLGKATATVEIYSADTYQAQGGGLSPAYKDQLMHDVGLWVHVQTPQVTLGPGGQFTDPFSMTIPLGTSPGEHIGAVVAQVNPGDQGSGGVGFGVVTRAALLVEANVPGQRSPSATATDLVGHLQDSRTHTYYFSINVHNTGNLLLNVNGNVVITDGSGKQVGSLKLQPFGAYAIPTGTLEVRTEPWTFTAGAFHVQANLGVVADDRPFTNLVSNSLDYSFTNWAVVAAVAAVGVAAAGAIGFAFVQTQLLRHRGPRVRKPAKGRARGKTPKRR